MEAALVCLLLFSVAALLYLVGYGWAFFLTPYGRPYVLTGHVKALAYKGFETHLGTGVSTSGKVVLTSSSSAAQYNVVLKFDSGESRIENNEDLFHDVEDGDRLSCTYRSKTVWGTVSHELISWEVEEKGRRK